MAIGGDVLVHTFFPGAVAARMRVYDTSVCLISAHLCSGEAEGDRLKRHSDFSEIVRRGAFPPDADLSEPSASMARSAEEMHMVRASSWYNCNDRDCVSMHMVKAIRTSAQDP
jgi:hypothetical protein